MLQGLLSVPGARAVVPFVRAFYGTDSIYLWTDNANVTHDIRQAEGGEQGDPSVD